MPGQLQTTGVPQTAAPQFVGALPQSFQISVQFQIRAKITCVEKQTLYTSRLLAGIGNRESEIWNPESGIDNMGS